MKTLSIPVLLVASLFAPTAWSQTARIRAADVAVCADVERLPATFSGCRRAAIAEACAQTRRGHFELPGELACARVALSRYRLCRDATPSYTPDLLTRDLVGAQKLAWCISQGVRTDEPMPPAAVRALSQEAPPPSVRLAAASVSPRPSAQILAEMDAQAEGAAGLAGGDAAAADVSTTVLQATATFLVERARVEVLDFLRRQLFDDLCGASDAEKRALPGGGGGLGRQMFPATCGVLGQAEGTNASLALPSLPAALLDDLEAAPKHLLHALVDQVQPDLSRLPPAERGALTPAQIQGQTERLRLTLHYAVNVLWEAARGLREQGPLRALEAAAEVDPGALPADLAGGFGVARARLKVAARFLRELQRVAADGEVTEGELAQVLLTVAEWAGANDVAAAAQWMEAHHQLFADLAARVVELRRANGAQRPQAVRALVLQTMQTVQGCLPDEAPFRDAAVTLREVAGCFDAFSSGNTLLGVTRLLSLRLVQQTLDRMPDGDAKRVFGRIRSHLLLVATLASADSPEAVHAALEAAAAPARSWREYRRRTAVFLSGWVGLSGGYEDSFAARGRDGFSLSPTAMLGVELGVPLPKNFSLNFFLSVLDLGALANLRFGNATNADTAASGTARQSARIDVASVLAPGLFVGVGLGDTPFLAALGFQFEPALREYYTCGSGTCGNAETLSSFRVGLTLAVDLPLLPVY